MARKPEPEELARLFDDPGGLRFIRSSYSGYKNQAILTFDWQGEQLQFVCAITEVLQGDVPTNARARGDFEERNPGVISQRLKKKKDWTEYELRREGLPLYLSDDWLLGELKRLGSQAAISKAYGYNSQSLSRRLIKLGIETRPRNTEEQRKEARRLRKQGLSLQAIAKQTGLSKPSVSRACRDLEN